MINVLPNNDTREHVEDTTCHCLPRIIEESGEIIVIHNSYDGRALFEEMDRDIRNTCIELGISWITDIEEQ